MSTETKIDKKWKILFEQHRIVDKVAQFGFLDITANEIKKVHEPRLMCKMDFRENVAKPFIQNGLSILAIKNGIYRIAPTSPFFDIDLSVLENLTVNDFYLPEYLETLDHENITNESQALDAAVASGMLDKALGEDSLLTVRGRRYTSDICFELDTVDTRRQRYEVTSVQIEVDGGYEGRNVLALIEAKMGVSDNMKRDDLDFGDLSFHLSMRLCATARGLACAE